MRPPLSAAGGQSGTGRGVEHLQGEVTGAMHTRRADLVGFVNGMPLLFVELKAYTKHIKAAYDGNLQDYKDTIPAL
jgi:type I site-specific restriction-modification system R (restriction) subunit